jgi:hypothetical protein
MNSLLHKKSTTEIVMLLVLKQIFKKRFLYRFLSFTVFYFMITKRTVLLNSAVLTFTK